MSAEQNVRILFCGEEFGRGFEYSREACSKLSGISLSKRKEEWDTLATELLGRALTQKNQGSIAIQVVRCPRLEVAAHIASADMLVPLMTRLDKALLVKAERARLILQFGVGLEGIDVPAATELGIQVSNIPSSSSGNALSCAEMVIYLMLACLRKAKEMDRAIQERILGLPIGDTLYGKTCLIMGFGNIARELTPRLKALGMRLFAVRQSNWPVAMPSAEEPQAALEAFGQWTSRLDFARRADVIVLACTETPETRGVIDAKFLAHCRPGVVIINVTRGGLLDYEAVSTGLRTRKIGAVGLDVHWQEPFDPEDEIAKHPRVHLTPHVAGVTELSYRGMADIVAQEAMRLQQGLEATVRINTIVTKKRMDR